MLGDELSYETWVFPDGRIRNDDLDTPQFLLARTFFEC